MAPSKLAVACTVKVMRLAPAFPNEVSRALPPDMFNPVSLGDECDFVELDDGRLLITLRTPKGCFRRFWAMKVLAWFWNAVLV